jgi:hypothetical protein
MIIFWTTRGNSDPVSACMAAMLGSRLERASLLYHYEDWIGREPGRWARIPKALQVFTDIEFLAGEMAGQAAALHQFLQVRGDVVLNHPLKSLKRLALHQVLHAAGINQFRSAAIGQLAEQELRFPLFLRHANDHRGSQTGLLRDAGALRTELARLNLRADRAGDWIATEFCDSADAQGLRHKYGAFIIAGRIIPRHLFFSRRWIIKEADELSPELLRREREYLEHNPHRLELGRIFALAGIDYGRIDYSWVEGRPQVWEINTNPMVFRPSHWWGPRAAQHRQVRAWIEAAWAENDPLTGAEKWARPGQWPVYPSIAACYGRDAIRYAATQVLAHR